MLLSRFSLLALSAVASLTSAAVIESRATLPDTLSVKVKNVSLDEPGLGRLG